MDFLAKEFIAFLVVVLIALSVFVNFLFINIPREREKAKKFSFLYFLFFFCLTLATSWLGVAAKTADFYKNLSKEVDLRNVTVMGKSTFTTQIRLFYEDGSIKKIELVPNTTRKEKNGQ